MVPLKLTFPPEFFKEEIRSGYKVSPQMKEVWAVELDLLSEFVRICEKHGLRYFAHGGTLIGAVRHRGFIPWDDDIDVVMPRRDYDKFMEIAPDELEYPYFMSTPLTEYRFWRTHVQIRNSDTTGAGKIEESLNNNKGIFIDVFPLDVVPDSLEMREKHRKKLDGIKWLMNADISVRANLPSKMKWIFPIKKLVTKILINDRTYRDLFKKYNQAEAMYSESGSHTVAHTSTTYTEKCVFKKEYYSGSRNVPFENIEIAVPVDFDSILKTGYGDYMKIPDVKGLPLHGELFFDTNNSYRKYYTQEAPKK